MIKVTKIFIVSLIIIIILFDVYAFNVGGREATMSKIIDQWAHEYPAFTFAMGFINGHLFYQFSRKAIDGVKNVIKQ